MSVRAIPLIAALLPLSGFGATAHAAPRGGEAAARYCARVRNDDALRRPPASLGPAIEALFHISDAAYALQSTVWRCAEGKVLACYFGANLPCGQADMQTSLPGTRAWCRAHPNTDFIPMVVTGHDTAYVWRCAGGVPKIVRRAGKLDRRGFFAEYWKPLP